MSLDRLILLRHGRTAWNAAGRMQGRLDPELDETGLAQATAAAAVVAEYEPAVLLASDQVRAWQTAEAVAKSTGLVARSEPRLRETSVGAWEGLDGDEVEAGWPGQMAGWHGDPTFAPPDGESRTDVAARALPVVAELDAELAGEEARATAVLVTHGGTTIALTASLLELPVATWPALRPLRNCRWAVVGRRRGRWGLVGWGLGA